MILLQEKIARKSSCSVTTDFDRHFILQNVTQFGGRWSEIEGASQEVIPSELVWRE